MKIIKPQGPSLCSISCITHAIKKLAGITSARWLLHVLDFSLKTCQSSAFRSLFRLVTNAKCAKLFTSLECRWRKARNWTRNCYRVGNNWAVDARKRWHLNPRRVLGCRLEHGGSWQSRGWVAARRHSIGRRRSRWGFNLHRNEENREYF